MAEPLKHIYSKKFIATLSIQIQLVDANFDILSFTKAVFSNDWLQLELKQRMHRIAQVLEATIIGSYETQLKVLTQVSKNLEIDHSPSLEYMFFPDFVEQFGLHKFNLSVRALSKFTILASAEFAVRPFILSNPEKMFHIISKWACGKNHHLRRLASEGMRPRLPWAMALPIYKQDPTPVLALLEQLMFDESLYVRRSVANNLNDISKDHPKRVINFVMRYKGQTTETDWLIKHACRGLLKQAYPPALKLFGLEKADHIKISNLKVESEVTFGNYLHFDFNLSSKQSLGNLRIEYAIHYMKANGKQSAKIFKISESDYAENQKMFVRRHALKPISTRKHYAGKHDIEIILNGNAVARESFNLEIPIN